jgi:hypothetical protein
MADPLSIITSAVGIIVPALHGTQLLLEDLQQPKDAPKTVKRLVEDVHSVDTALKLLQRVEEREWGLLGAGIAEQSKATISSCTQACTLFRPDLQKWTRHSEDGKLAWLAERMWDSSRKTKLRLCRSSFKAVSSPLTSSSALQPYK